MKMITRILFRSLFITFLLLIPGIECVEGSDKGKDVFSWSDKDRSERGREEEGVKRLFDQVTFPQTYKRSDAGGEWVEGGSGLSLFYANEDIVSIGVRGAWSEEFSVNMVTSPHTGSFEAVDWTTLRAYQLSYSMSYMPGFFSCTQLLTITPRYMMVNCLDEDLVVTQKVE